MPNGGQSKLDWMVVLEPRYIMLYYPRKHILEKLILIRATKKKKKKQKELLGIYPLKNCVEKINIYIYIVHIIFVIKKQLKKKKKKRKKERRQQK
jgi:hypothetical protein